MLSSTGRTLSSTGRTCLKTDFFFFFFLNIYIMNIYIYIYIYIFFFFHFLNGGAVIHFDLFNCLSSRFFCMFTFSCSNFTTDCICRLSTVIHSWDIFKLSMRITAVP